MRPKMMQLSVMALTFLVSGPWSARALPATHYVAKDGTGQFTVIQDALDVAAEGDTIRIGAGRYDEFREYVPPVADAAVIMHVQTSNLTIIGAGRDSVIVGPGQAVSEVNGRLSRGVLVASGNLGTVLRGLTVEYVHTGVYLDEAIEAKFLRVRFATNSMVVLSSTNGVLVEESEFEWTTEFGFVRGIASFAGGAIPNTTIRGCVFRGGGGTGILLDGGANSTIESCEFYGLTLAVDILNSAPVAVKECRFLRSGTAALAVEDHSAVILDASVIEGSLRSGVLISGSSIEIERSLIRGGDSGVISLAAGVDVLVRDSDILGDGGPRVLSRASLEFTTRLDLRHNFWGSLDSLEIASWIDDGADDGPGDCTLWYCPRDTVEFWPVLERSVEAKPVPVSGLKGRYRRLLPPGGQD